MALLSLDRYDPFFYNLELYCQNTVSHFIPVLTDLDRLRKIYAACEAAIGNFQIVEYTVLFDDLWCYPVTFDAHVSALQEDDDILHVYTGEFKMNDNGVIYRVEIVKRLPIN